MDFLRRHMFVIICALVGAGGVAAGVTGHQSMAKVVTELEKVTALDRQLGSLQSRPVNARQIDAAKERIDMIVADYEEVIDRAKKLYRYQQIVPDALPYGEPQMLIEFRRKYHAAMNAMLDDLSWGTSATSSDVRIMQERIDLTLFSLADAATMLGVSKSTIRRAVDRGDLEVVKLTEKLVRVTAASVVKWIADSSRQAATS